MQPDPTNSVSGDSLIIKGKWLTEKKIGQGAFGMIDHFF
jgi:hypothetical protein